jgi:uncharacterized protein (DUF2235 family)
MDKNIVICCDGTGQELDVQRTNVVRLFSVLDLSNPNAQIAYYDPGVGTIPVPGALTWVSRQLTLNAGLLAGYGLLDNVSRAYSFLVDRYEEGDRIYLFGFSRGAFTVRVLAGLLHRIEVLHPTAKNLIPYALKLYEPHYTHYDAKKREEFRSVTGEFRDFFRTRKVDIRFLGLWDTVKAFGIFWPRSLPHIRHNPDVGIVRHALALDERRRSYLPTTWRGLDGYLEEPVPSGQHVKEVWFAGNHKDVGGGHPEKESGLSWISLKWMIDEVRKCCRELRFIDEKDIEKKLDLTIKSRLPTDLDELDKPYWKLHPSPSPGWRLLDLAPRPELENAPPRSTNQREHLEPGSPVPVGWPKRKLRFRPITGRRHIEQFKRGNNILVHKSVRKLIQSGKYQLKVDNVVFDGEEPA